jgi:transketolase
VHDADRLAVREMPGSGRPAELLRAAHIDAASIAKAVERLVGRQAHACYVCGGAATWRIAIAGEDEPRTEEFACEAHARGHMSIAREAS